MENQGTGSFHCNILSFTWIWSKLASTNSGYNSGPDVMTGGFNSGPDVMTGGYKSGPDVMTGGLM